MRFTSERVDVLIREAFVSRAVVRQSAVSRGLDRSADTSLEMQAISSVYRATTKQGNVTRSMTNEAQL